MDKCAKWIAFGWSAFAMENLILSENRQMIIDRIGDKTYHGMYSTLSTLACGSVAYGYIKHGPGLLMKSKFGPLRTAIGFGTAAVGAIGVGQLLPKFQLPIKSDGSVTCPFDFKDKSMPENGGLQRVTRHPTFYSIGLLGLGFAITTPYVGRLALLTGPLFVAIIGTHHQDSRFRRGIGGTLTEEREKETSNLPFIAILSGKNDASKLVQELKLTNVCVAVALVSLMFLTKRAMRPKLLAKIT